MIPGEAAMQHCGSGGRRNGSIYAHSDAVMPCSCSLFQDVDCVPGTFSIFFATSAINEHPPEDGDPSRGSYSSTVDCTLSLGTPSTRHQYHTTSKPSPLSAMQSQQRSNKTLPWDLMPPSQTKQFPAAASAGSGTSVLRAGAGGGGLKLGGDHLLSRRCANCDTTSTPLWRNGPRGPKSLCNACGIRYKKEEKRAGSTVASLPSTCSPSSSSAMSAATHVEPPLAQHHQQQQHPAGYDYYHNPWYYSAALQTTARKKPSTPTFISAISTVDDSNPVDGATALPFLSWRLNVSAPHAADFVPSLVHDCT